MKRKIMLVGFFALCLLHTVYIGVAGILPYEPWSDINDDGIIDIEDLTDVSLRLWEEGTPINKAAVQFEGNISVAAAAFVPRSDVKHWTNIGWSLFNNDIGTVSFYASVQLPHGATITKLIFYWYDAGDDYIECYLYRFEQGVSYEMLSATSTGSAGDGSSYDDTIYSPWATVNNNQYAYLMRVEIPPSPSHSDYIFQYAFIEYEYPA